MYGTRDAAQNWELEYTEMMTEAGFRQGAYSACVFYHEEKNVRVVVHGDDFTVLGPSKGLDWFRGVVQQRMEMKFKNRLERGKPGALRILNRIVTVTENGLEYEADQRHAEILMRDMGVDENCKGVVTPGVTVSEGGHTGEVLVGEETRFRAVAARGNYLGQDRMDMQFAAKEISRFMSKPEEQDWRSAKRLARYLKDNKRMVIEYKFQELPEKIVMWSDSDFAGCRRTRRSTSAGVAMFGGHCLKTYSSTQPLIALSVGEAEYYGIVKAGCTGLGVQSLFKDLGVDVEVQINTDSSTGKSIASRRGAGKVRHLDTRELWIQERVARGDIWIQKVRGEDNVADGLTKHVDRQKMDQYMKECGFVRRSGRHELSPALGENV